MLVGYILNFGLIGNNDELRGRSEVLKIRDGFMLREVAGQWVVVPLGERVVEFNGIMTLSESGALLWKKMENNIFEEELLRTLLEEYSVDEETAKADVLEFITALRERGLIKE